MQPAWARREPLCKPRSLKDRCSANKREEKSRSRTGSLWSIVGTEEVQPPEQGVLPQLPLYNLVRILQTCRKRQDRPHAFRVHAYMLSHGLETHALLGNYLVPTLVDVGCIHNAHQVFDRLLHVNEWSWDSLISGYIYLGKPQHALSLYKKMPKDGSLQPHGHTFVSLLRACLKLKDWETGGKVHADVAKLGALKRDIYVGSALVDMYAKSGSLMKAQQVFDSLPVKDLVCWTALVAGYAENGHGQGALHYFERMQLQNICPDVVTFVCTLKACASEGDLVKGEEIHVEIERQELTKCNIPIGNALIDMYIKCGSLKKAQEVFNRLPMHDVVSWTALVAGYIEYGHGEEALNLIEQMQREGVAPNSITYVCILKACGSTGALEKGRQTHNKIETLGLLTKDLLLGNTLIDMYARCASLSRAKEVFERLTTHSVVSWATLIGGYTEQGYGEEALEFYDQMQIEGAIPDAFTFACSLRACAIAGVVNKGQEIHAEIERQGLLEKDIVIGNALVDMYTKCGLITIAKQLLNALTDCDVVSWTALISGYVNHGHFEEALKCFEEMQLAGICPNMVTFVCALKACSSLGATGKGQEIHVDIARHRGMERDQLIGNTLVDVYAKGGLLVMAQQVFDGLSVRTAVSWLSLISGYAEHGCGEEALQIFEQMQVEGFSPDAATFVCSLKACCSVGATDKGQEIHIEIERRGLMEGHLIGNTLITMYSFCGILAKAQEVFEQLPVKDAVSWTALMAGYAQSGDSENAFSIFDRMLGEGQMPDPVSFVVVLKACSRRGLFDTSLKLFDAMSKDHGSIPALQHHTCLVDLLVRTGHLGMAEEMIKRTPERSSLVMWNAALNSCKNWGNVEFAEQAFQQVVY